MSQRVLITGGTGSVGQALVSAFTGHGYEVHFQYQSQSLVADALSEATGAESFALSFDDAFELPREDFDIIVHCAGVNLSRVPIHEISDEELSVTLAVNLVAPFRITRACLPHMLNRNWGRIISIGSIYSLRGSSNNGSYNISKHALTGMTKSLCSDYASRGITANDICPAAIESDMMRTIAARYESEGKGTSEEYLQAVRAANPTHRLARPQEIASAALFLASEGAAFVNGSAILIDGGQLA